MPWNGSGIYQRVRNWVNDASSGIKIRADYHDSEDDAFAAGISNCIAKDGQSTILANIGFNGKRITNLADPVNPQDAVTQAWVGANVTGGALIADSPPAGAKVGNLYWESDTGNLFLRYDDGTSVQWVQVNVASPSQPIIDSGVFKISGGTLAAAATSVEIILPTSGYMSFELIGQYFNPADVGTAYSLTLQVAFAGIYQNTGYAWHWDRIQATATASAGWAAGSSTNSPVGMLLPWVQNGGANIGGHYFKMQFPCIQAGNPRWGWIADGETYGQGAYERQRTGGAVGSGGVPPDKIKLDMSGIAINAGFKWQLNGIK